MTIRQNIPLFEPYKTLQPKSTHGGSNDDDDDNDDGVDDNDDQNLFDTASTLRTSRKSPLLWSMCPPWDHHDYHDDSDDDEDEDK